MYTACLHVHQKNPLCTKCTHVVLSLQVRVLIRRPRCPGHPLGTEVPGRRGVGPTLCTARRGPVRELRAERIASHHAVRDRLQDELARGLANCNGLEPPRQRLAFAGYDIHHSRDTILNVTIHHQAIWNQEKLSFDCEISLASPWPCLYLEQQKKKKKKKRYVIQF
jgi:hypothetical protein